MEAQKKRRFSISVLGAILIALLGILGPIIWDRYKTKSTIELRHLSHITLAEKLDSIEKLEILYDGKPISCVDRSDFMVANTGRKPIVRADFISPLRLTFPKSEQLLDVKIELLRPSDLAVDFDVNSPAKSLALSFPLLNPDDFVHFSVLTDGSAAEFEATARIFGIQALTVVNLKPPAEDIPKKVPWAVYPVGLFSFFALFIVIFVASFDIPAELRVKRAMKEGTLKFPEDRKKETFLAFAKTTFSFTSTGELRPLLELIKGFKDDKPLSNEQIEQIKNKAVMISSSVTSNVTMLIFFLVIGAAGVAWIVSKLL